MQESWRGIKMKYHIEFSIDPHHPKTIDLIEKLNEIIMELERL